MYKNVLDYFSETVNRFPEKTAIIHNEESITFLELKYKSIALAKRLLADYNLPRRAPVAVFLPKSIEVVTSDLAALYTGCFFSNLDVKTPAERIHNILNVMQPAVIITNSKYVKLLEQCIIDNIAIVNIEDVVNQNIDENIISEEICNRLETQIDTDPFCIINTSGSTGTPKGVVLNHRSFLDFLNWAIEEFGFDENTTVGSLSPVVFDIYEFELCLMMFKGAKIVQLDASLAAFPARLLTKLQDQHVNFIFWVPTIMVNIANMGLLDKIALPDLRLVWFAGEVFPTKQFNVWKSHLNQAKFVNLYGPIEITLDCIYFIAKNIQDENKSLPIGVPCKNTDVLILNDHNELCRTGEIGEICVRGTSLAMGYYNNPEKTSSAFVQNPLNMAYPEQIYRTGDLAYTNDQGLIIFKGRKDSLIKHMGYRIELGEIEHLIVNKLKLVSNCCAVYDYSRKEINLFYERKENIIDSDIRKALINEVPKYMIPTKYMVLNEMPRNTNGKIDRLQLSNMVNLPQ